MSVSLIIACLEVAVGAVVGFVGGVAFQKYGVSSNPSAEAQAVLQSSETDALQLSLRSDERREIPVQEETSTDGASEKPKAIRSQVSSLLPGGVSAAVSPTESRSFATGTNTKEKTVSEHVSHVFSKRLPTTSKRVIADGVGHTANSCHGTTNNDRVTVAIVRSDRGDVHQNATERRTKYWGVRYLSTDSDSRGMSSEAIGVPGDTVPATENYLHRIQTTEAELAETKRKLERAEISLSEKEKKIEATERMLNQTLQDSAELQKKFEKTENDLKEKTEVSERAGRDLKNAVKALEEEVGKCKKAQVDAEAKYAAKEKELQDVNEKKKELENKLFLREQDDVDGMAGDLFKDAEEETLKKLNESVKGQLFEHAKQAYKEEALAELKQREENLEKSNKSLKAELAAIKEQLANTNSALLAKTKETKWAKATYDNALEGYRTKIEKMQKQIAVLEKGTSGAQSRDEKEITEDPKKEISVQSSVIRIRKIKRKKCGNLKVIEDRSKQIDVFLTSEKKAEERRASLMRQSLNTSNVFKKADRSVRTAFLTPEKSALHTDNFIISGTEEQLGFDSESKTTMMSGFAAVNSIIEPAVALISAAEEKFSAAANRFQEAIRETRVDDNIKQVLAMEQESHKDNIAHFTEVHEPQVMLQCDAYRKKNYVTLKKQRDKEYRNIADNLLENLQNLIKRQENNYKNDAFSLGEEPFVENTPEKESNKKNRLWKWLGL